MYVSRVRHRITQLQTNMHITVNGESRPIAEGKTLADLLAELNLATTKVAAEVNRTIVSKSTYADTVLCDGDAIEIIHFIGGG